MLSVMRSKASRWFAGGLLFLVLVAIVVTGFGTGGFGGIDSLSGGGGTTDQLVSVDGQPITAPQVSELVNRAYARAHDQQPTLQMAAFLGQGAWDQTLEQLIVTGAVQHYGAARGLTVSRAMVDREIVNIPAFRNFTGRFDQNSFRGALAQQGVTEAQLRDDISRSLMQRQLLGPVALGVRTPEGIAREYASLLLERRRGTVGVVPTAVMLAGIEPTEAQLGQFYQLNRAAFTIPERRVLKYALISAAQVPAQATTPTEAEIAAVYRNSTAAYGPRETRSLQSIVLPDRAAAQAFAQRVRGGTSFIDAASQAGFSARDVTFADQRRDQFTTATNAEIATAAYGAAQGAVVGPIRSELGFHVVRVDRVTTTPARPLEAVRADIARAIETRKRTEALAQLVTRAEDAIADGSSFEEVARTEHLTVVTTPALTAAGQPVAGSPPFQAPPELRPLVRPAFDIDADDPEPVVEPIQANERYALLGVDRVLPAAPPPLAQIRDRVRAAYVQRAALLRARAAAQAIAERINRGMPVAQAFAQAQLRLPPPQSVNTRRIDIAQSQNVPQAIRTLFTIPEHRAEIVAVPNGAGYFVVAHEQRTPGDGATNPALIANTRQQFQSVGSEEFAQQFARAVQLAAKVRRNDGAIVAERRRVLSSVSALEE